MQREIINVLFLSILSLNGGNRINWSNILSISLIIQEIEMPEKATHISKFSVKCTFGNSENIGTKRYLTLNLTELLTDSESWVIVWNQHFSVYKIFWASPNIWSSSPDIWLKPLYTSYHKFSNKGASPNKGAPSVFWGVPWLNILRFWTYLSQKMVRFSFCKKPLGTENALYLVISLLLCPAHLSENLR